MCCEIVGSLAELQGNDFMHHQTSESEAANQPTMRSYKKDQGDAMHKTRPHSEMENCDGKERH